MPRIPEDVIERLKREVSIETRARGIDLTRHGADLIGLYPFHDDKESSLVISPAKNLWHCLEACGAAGKSGGTVIYWVMRAEGVSFRHAVELLTSGAWAQTGTRAKHSTVRKLPAPIERDVDDAQLLQQVVNFYHGTLKQSPESPSAAPATCSATPWRR